MYTLGRLGMKQSKIIGLTGGSGSGKSTVASALKACGAFVIDCDKIAHENMSSGGVAYNDIVEEFGREILSPNGEIDRKRLGGIVFNDSKALERLNTITHGYIVARVKVLTSAEKNNSEVIVIDAPLLRQAGLDSLCDEVWVTDAPYEVRLARIVERDGITPEQAADRLKNQGDYAEADRRIITNFETIEELESYIKELI
jgi:dephospho-CoA kinase